MTPSRDERRAERSLSVRVAMISVALALVPVILLKGFTVDDAWIPARYAAHVAAGLGYRFNAGGPVTDGVTPLPFTPLLVLLSGMSVKVESCWRAARWTGAVAWLLSVGTLGRFAAGAGVRPWRHLPLLLLAVIAPLGAWSVAGLESGIVMALTTAAAVSMLGRAEPVTGIGLAGIAASFRPELFPFALTLAVTSFPFTSLNDTTTSRRRWLELVRYLALACAPWVMVAFARWITFGTPVPLSAIAKPSDIPHGLVYVISGLVLGGAPLLVMGRLARGPERSIVAACVAHSITMIAVGGDWMPLWRLMTPVLPPMIAVGIAMAERASPAASIARVVLGAALALVPWWQVGRDAGRVVDVRDALIKSAREDLAGARVIATLDVGWVGASTEATIVDLAGVTDPEVARLAGGHTTKNIPGTLLPRREVDTLVLLRSSMRPRPPAYESGAVSTRDDGGPFERGVEEHVAADSWIQDDFETSAILRSGTLSYVVLHRRPRTASPKRRPSPPAPTSSPSPSLSNDINDEVPAP